MTAPSSLYFNDRYTEVQVGPKSELVDEALKQIYPDLTGASFNTGKYVNKKWVQGFDIEFELFGESTESSETNIIKIYNPNPKYPHSKFGEGSAVVVKSGYMGLYDVVFSGKVDTMSYIKEGTSRILELRCSEKQDSLIEMRVGGKTFRSGEKWSEVIKWLIEQTEASLAFLPVSSHDLLPSAFQVTTEKSIKGWLDDIVSRMFHKPDTEELIGEADNGYLTWKWYIAHGRIYVMPETWGIPAGIRMSKNTGLYSVKPSASQDSATDKPMMTLKMLLNPWVTKQSLLYVEESELMYKVLKYKFISSSKEHITEVEAEEVSADKMVWIYATKGIPLEVEENMDYEDGFIPGEEP